MHRFVPGSVTVALLTALVAAGGVASAAASGSPTVATSVYGACPAPPSGPPPRPGRPGPHGPGGPPGPGLAGTVEGSSGSGFVLRSHGRTYTVVVGSTTTYDLAPGFQASRGDVQPGEQVDVAGTVSGSQVTASAVHVHLRGVRGTVTGVTGDTVALQEPSGRTATIALSSSPDVQVGQQVEGFGSWRRNTLVAKVFRVVPAHLDGVVESVSGSTAQVKTPSGQNVTLEWSGSTRFARGPAGSASANLVTAGIHVHAAGQRSGSTFVATRVDLPPAPPSAPAVPPSVAAAPRCTPGSGSGS